MNTNCIETAAKSDPFLALLLTPATPDSAPNGFVAPELTLKEWCALLWPRTNSPAPSHLPADAGVVYGGDLEEVF